MHRSRPDQSLVLVRRAGSPCLAPAAALTYDFINRRLENPPTRLRGPELGQSFPTTASGVLWAWRMAMLEQPSPLAAPVGIYFFRGVTLVRLHGRFGDGNPHHVEAIAAGLAAAHEPVVVNVARVTSMDLGGLKWLMRLTGPVRTQGDPLILESPTECVEDVLALTGCHTWFTAITRPGPIGRRDTERLIQSMPA
jgi:anti-anti-sigma factor